MKIFSKKSFAIFLSIVLIAVSFSLYFPARANAGLLSSASIQLSDPRAGQASVGYTITYTFPGTTSIKCIDIILADTTGHIVTTTNPATTIPSGLLTTSAAKGTIVGGGLTDANWSLYNTVNGVLQLEYSTGGASTATSVTIPITGVTNPTATPFYAQVATYSTLSTHTCSGLVDTSNVMAVVSTAGVATTVTVDPTLTFSVAGSSGAVNSNTAANAITDALRIPFGNVPADGATATQAAQLLTASTNAAHGYSIYIRNNQLLTDSASDTIRASGGTPGSPISFDASSSQSSFAYTTDSTTINFGGSNKWAGLTTTNAAIDTQTSPQNAKTVKVEYQLQLSNIQSPGTYSNVITYTAAPVY